jgi:hypothetical protein
MKRIFFALITLAAMPAFQTAGAQSEKVVGGPYVVNAGPRSATVMWVVQTGQVSVGTDPNKLDKAMPVLRAERTSLNNLKAGTTYYYDSFGGDAGKGSFKTPPAGTSSFQFVVYGDTRTRHDVHRKVIAAILKYTQPDLILHTGDLVENGNDSSLWPIFFNAERDLLRKAAFFPTPGNHERNSKNYYDFMDTRPYYSFEWGGVHFALIDSDIANVGATKQERDAFWKEQTAWLENDLEGAAKADFRFIFAHHPPMTAVAKRQGDNPHMTALEPMLEKYKVQAGFFGHDHNYQHYLKNGVNYFITGGGGAPLYDVNTPPPVITKKVETTENFVVVKVDGKKARIEGYRPNGEIIEITDIAQ